MSFFSSLMGGTFADNRVEGDRLRARGSLGEARMAYERALRKGKGVPEADLAAVRGVVAACRLELARRRLAEADGLAEAGEVDEAREILDELRDLCEAEEILAAVAERRTRYEAESARQMVDDAREMTEEELLAVIAGTWTEAQADEYAELPEEFVRALVASHDGEHARAAEMIRAVLESADLPIEPRHAWFELGRELAAAGDDPGAVAALERMLGTGDGAVDEELDGEVTVAALTQLAQCLARIGKRPEAIAALERSTRTDPESHLPLLNLGIFLRSGPGERAPSDLERALGVLERAVTLMGQLHPDFRVVRELGLTLLELGREDEAEQTLYAVVEHEASRGTHDQFDPLAAVPLARLYEKRGKLELAADIWRHLAVGHDVRNHFAYNREAARLLLAAGGDRALAGRYLSRAEELARTDEERAAVARVRGDASPA
ncbi:MAG TPA: tetratricopeptide repeat protein [Polyangia bacterium]|nr:tetratricopeptide repeat protein [Polyangia bacterium]